MKNTSLVLSIVSLIAVVVFGILFLTKDGKSAAAPQAGDQTEVSASKGDIVYIERKLPSWMGEELLHVVKAGETIHDISQLYGIRLKSLTKQNSMRSNVTLAEGRTIRIQKW